MSNWRRTTIGDVFEVNPRRDLPRRAASAFIPMDALPEHGRDVTRVERREFTGTGTRFRNGDTLLARITPCLENGKTAHVSGLAAGEVAHGSTEYIVLAGKPGVTDGLFGYYLARSPDLRAELVASMEGTSGRQRVPVEAVTRYEVLLPPLDDQQDIARTLGALDDKIELNRRTSETLEAMARALFQSWFVDFDPVRAKADGEPEKSICERLGLTPELLALFPETVPALVSVEPPCWRVAPLSQLTSYLSRGISPKYIDKAGVLVLNQRCVRDGRVDPSKGRRHDDQARSVTGRQLRPGDVLVNSTGVGTLGRVAQIMAVDEPTVVDSHITVVRADSRLVTPAYVAATLAERQADIEALAEGSTGQTELSRARLGALALLVPPVILLEAFSARVAALRARSHAGEVQNAALAAARDALLPRLLSGELSPLAARA